MRCGALCSELGILTCSAFAVVNDTAQGQGYTCMTYTGLNEDFNLVDDPLADFYTKPINFDVIEVETIS